MKELVSYIAEALVDETSRISINEIEGNQTNIIELKVAKEDIGKVIGRQGRTADAIRTITVKEGIDPREFSLVAFGGAGPAYACRVATCLGIPKMA